jgi:beta-glucosidase
MAIGLTDEVRPLYRDPARSIDERIDDLTARMTLAEKAAQLGNAWMFELADGSALRAEAASLLADGLGQVTRMSGASSLPPGLSAVAANAIQRYLVEQTRRRASGFTTIAQRY